MQKKKLQGELTKPSLQPLNKLVKFRKKMFMWTLYIKVEALIYNYNLENNKQKDENIKKKIWYKPFYFYLQ